MPTFFNPIITAGEFQRLEAYMQPDANGGTDRTGFYVELYRLTGSQMALEMAQVSSNSDAIGGLAWIANALIKLSNPAYDLDTTTFSKEIALSVLQAVGQNQNADGSYTVPTERGLVEATYAPWVEHQLGDTAPPAVNLFLDDVLDFRLSDAVSDFGNIPVANLGYAAFLQGISTLIDENSFGPDLQHKLDANPGSTAFLDENRGIIVVTAADGTTTIGVFEQNAVVRDFVQYFNDAGHWWGQNLPTSYDLIQTIENAKQGYVGFVDSLSGAIEHLRETHDQFLQQREGLAGEAAAMQQILVDSSSDLLGSYVQSFQDRVAVAADGLGTLVRAYEQTSDFSQSSVEGEKQFFSDITSWVADQTGKVADLFGATQTEASEIGNRITAEGQRAATSGLDVLRDFLNDSLNHLGNAFGGDGSNGGFPILAGSLEFLKQLRDKFYLAEATQSPIVLDLDGNGITTTAVGSGTFFDHDGNGFAESTGWINPNDGLLVLDRNGDGQINDGGELFGNQTLLANGQKAANGFQALAELDGNGDGRIDANDSAFADLKVWKDANGDGLSEAGELFSLGDAGVQSINVGYADSTFVDANGNQHREIGSFTRTDGTVAAAEDIWFQRDTLNSVADVMLPVSADIAVLPDLQGYGNVYDLHQAMARDTSGQLEALIQSFANENDVQARGALLKTFPLKYFLEARTSIMKMQRLKDSRVKEMHFDTQFISGSNFS